MLEDINVGFVFVACSVTSRGGSRRGLKSRALGTSPMLSRLVWTESFSNYVLNGATGLEHVADFNVEGAVCDISIGKIFQHLVDTFSRLLRAEMGSAAFKKISHYPFQTLLGQFNS